MDVVVPPVQDRANHDAQPREATAYPEQAMDGLDPERQRLREQRDERVPWWRWGPYLAERQWGTVREDYSANGTAWDFFPHEHARSRAYRWGEDGLLGVADSGGHLCFPVSLW